MKRRVFLLATLALVGVVAFAAGSVASAQPALAGSAAGATRASCYADAVGDAGDAPDITLVWIRPVGASVEIDARLAGPTELGSSGDVRARSFDFSVASLREQADIAPGEGLAAYPGGPSSRCGYASRAPTLPARWSAPRTTP